MLMNFKLEASTLKITSLNLGSARPKLTTFHAVKIQYLIQYNGLLISSKLNKPLLGCRASTSEAQSKKSSDGNHDKEIFLSAAVSQLIPSSSEIAYLLTELSDTASIAEFQLKLGEFELHVMRNLNGKSTPPPPITAPVTVSTAVEAPNSNSSISTPPLVSSGGKDAEEGFVVIQSPRVAFLGDLVLLKERVVHRVVKTKENQVVNEGQVLCYIDQLGGEMPVEADVSGEVVSILLEDGGMFLGV